MGTDAHPELRASPFAELRRELKLGPAGIGSRLGVATSTVHKVLVRLGLNRLSWIDRPTGEVTVAGEAACELSCRSTTPRNGHALRSALALELVDSTARQYPPDVAASRVPTQVTVTGAAGQVSYALLFRIASGALLGSDQPVVLRLLEVEHAMSAVEGVMMELDDCAFPLLADIESTSNPDVAFDGTQVAFLVGGAGRTAGMERSDLLAMNGSIFKPQGQALVRNAASDVRILVVANPCNTNCLIARQNAQDIPEDRWFAMTRLDENRAAAQLAQRAGVSVTDVTRVAIWGNHSATQFPDYVHAEIGGMPAQDVISDETWLSGEFLTTVQRRGAEVIATRGAGSAASAASAAIDSIRSVLLPTAKGDWHSLAVCSRGEYGIPEGLQFGFPVRSDGTAWEIVEGIEHGAFASEQIAKTTDELLAERAEAADLLP